MVLFFPLCFFIIETARYSCNTLIVCPLIVGFHANSFELSYTSGIVGQLEGTTAGVSVAQLGAVCMRPYTQGAGLTQ